MTTDAAQLIQLSIEFEGLEAATKRAGESMRSELRPLIDAYNKLVESQAPDFQRRTKKATGLDFRVDRLTLHRPVMSEDAARIDLTGDAPVVKFTSAHWGGRTQEVPLSILTGSVDERLTFIEEEFSNLIHDELARREELRVKQEAFARERIEQAEKHLQRIEEDRRRDAEVTE